MYISLMGTAQMRFEAVIPDELGSFLILPFWGQLWRCLLFAVLENALVAQVGIGGELNAFWGWKQGEIFFY